MAVNLWNIIAPTGVAFVSVKFSRDASTPEAKTQTPLSS
jgi:hypothetical protein